MKKTTKARRSDPLLSGSRATLRRQRARLGLTIAAFAELVGCGTTTVSRCEAANELPRNPIVRGAYAAALSGAK